MMKEKYQVDSQKNFKLRLTTTGEKSLVGNEPSK